MADPTMRVDADVHAVLTKAAKGAKTSATRLGNDLLRQGLGMVEPARAHATPSRARRAENARMAADDCKHPVGRRLGSMCAACGKPVGKS